MTIWKIVAAGVLLGVAYAISPLTVVCVPVVFGLARWVGADLAGRERRWFITVVLLAVVVRLALIGGLSLSANGTAPFETFFGDELFFKNRSLWIRNYGLGVPMSPADVIYAFEDVGISSYLYALAVIQAVFGNASYGVHVINSVCYLTAVLLLFRLVRPVFGGVAALSGLIVLLFTPSLFMWSISALKEPSYTLAAALELWCAVRIARAGSWRSRGVWLIGVIAGAVVLESLRRGGSMVALTGVVGGLFFGYVLARPKATLATAVLLPVAIAVAMTLPPVQERALHAARSWAIYHSGHVGSNGYSYHILDGLYYIDGLRLYTMPAPHAIRYVVDAYVAYVTEPVPWRIESRALLAYLPEQMFWCVLLALAPFGVVAGVRRDVMLTMLLSAHALGAVTVVAMTSGNIGTLIRHRGLVMPYLVWLAGLGLFEVARAALHSSPIRVPRKAYADAHS